jgi:hypothetical protein
VPDSYGEHVKLMFDLQAVAFAADVTRVFAFKLSRDVSNRVYPETGVTTGFHIASHHNDREDRILDLMGESESLEKNVKTAEVSLKAERAQVEAEKQQARERTEAIVGLTDLAGSHRHVRATNPCRAP